MRYTLTFLEDALLFDRAEKGWRWLKGDIWHDVSLIETVPPPGGDYHVLEAPILGQRPRVTIRISLVALQPETGEDAPDDRPAPST